MLVLRCREDPAHGAMVLEPLFLCPLKRDEPRPGEIAYHIARSLNLELAPSLSRAEGKPALLACARRKPSSRPSDSSPDHPCRFDPGLQNTAPMAPPEHGPVFVLIHSPLVGPTTWSPLADELERRGREAVVPSLLGVADAPSPQWRHVPEAVRAATAGAGGPAVLVGHSGGGLLLPVIAEALRGEVDALVFVDSFLPPVGGSLQLALPGFMDQLRALACAAVLPPWSSWFDEGAMRELVPDESLRAALEAEMPRLPLSYFEASVPLPDGWDARRCAYLKFTAETYGPSAAEARDRGWQVAEVQGVRHLAMATHPVAVADALLDLQRTLSHRPRR
jgi:pimeloyl-ACP methyl ester carboxylesterase